VIDHLQSIFKSDGTAILWIYCNYKEKSDQTSANLIGALLNQLILCRGTVSDNVRSLYEEHRRRNTRPAYNHVLKVLQSEVGSYSKTFIVVDALDECPEDSGIRRDLLNGLRSLIGNVNLMITSRPLPAIEREFDGKTRLDIHATREDVGRYVRDRIGREYRLSLLVKADPALQDAVVDTIVSNVEGM